jgi:peptidoglycan/xylan/chitin deacetylase (PgdA/CDA1 family)
MERENESRLRGGATTRVLAILGYHKIGEPSPGGWETWNYVPESTFADHLAYLGGRGWQVIDLATFLRGLAEPASLPERSALVTFDDGYRSIRTSALPILARFGHPAVLFVPTDFIGKSNSFDADIEPEEAICDWEDLRVLESARVSIQSHGVSHRRFSELEPAEQEEELLRSRSTLEAELTAPVKVFAFPYGDDGKDPNGVRPLLERAGYEAACLYGGGTNLLPIADRHRLTRLAMGPDTDLDALLGEA